MIFHFVTAAFNEIRSRRRRRPSNDHRSMPDEGDEIALASRFDAEHAEAVVGVMEVTRSTSPAKTSSRDVRARFPAAMP